MAALDAVNAHFGGDTLRPQVSGLNRTWTARARNYRPRYTTRIEEILKATAF